MYDTIIYKRVQRVAVLLLLLTTIGCGLRRTNDMEAMRAKTDSVVAAISSADSLRMLAGHYRVQGNMQAEAIVYNALGKMMREEANFDTAIVMHERAFELARAAGDTITLVKILNNLGTNYRRLGVLDRAAAYHYQALTLADAMSDDDSYDTRKDRVVSLNGIGNAQLTMDNLELADSAFRMALQGNQALGNRLGQAINYANLGSIFEKRGMLDSAMAYQQQSMQLNREAGSELGVALCHRSLGDIYKRKGDQARAIDHYNAAYRLMRQSHDSWHWLEPCLALAGIHISMGKLDVARHYLDSAWATARRIHSTEHLAIIYREFYRIYSLQGDVAQALNYYKLSDEMDDSVKSAKNRESMLQLRRKYERSHLENMVSTLWQDVESERTMKKIFGIAGVVIVVLLIGFILVLVYAMRLRCRIREHADREEMQGQLFTNITHEFRTPPDKLSVVGDRLHMEVSTDRHPDDTATHCMADQ